MKALSPTHPTHFVISHVRAHNRFLSVEYLENLSKNQLGSYCHPYYRYDYAKLLDIVISQNERGIFKY